MEKAEDGQKKHLVYTIIFIIIGLLIVVALIYWFWQSSKDGLTNVTYGPIKTTTVSPSPSQDPYKGFLTLHNTDFAYSIKYPSGATISYLDAASLNESHLSSEKACTTIKTMYGHVIIRAPEAKDAAVFCGRTGVGQNYKNIDDSVTIMGKKYDAPGMYDDVTKMGYRDEFHGVSLDSGAAMEYGVNDFKMSSTDPTFESAMNELKKIVESYQED